METQSQTKLMGLQFKIVYKRGLENKTANALSRRPNLLSDSQPLKIFAISQASPVLLEQVVSDYTKDYQAIKIFAALSLGSKVEGLSLSSDIINRFKGTIWIGSNLELQQQILSNLHSSALGGWWGGGTFRFSCYL